MKPQVISAVFFTTSTYEDQYGSSFTTHFDGGVKERLLRSTERGTRLNSVNLADAVGDAVTMTARRGLDIEIPGGWGEKRLSFIITFLISDYAGSTLRQVLTGYTDYNGVSEISGTLDDDMRLFINNSIIIRDTVMDTGKGRILRPRIESSEYVLRGRRHEERSGWGRKQGERLIRPHDIFNDLSIAEISQYHSGGDRLIDTRADFTGDIKMGTRRENNAADWLSTILRAGVTAETTEQPRWNSESQFAGEEMSRNEIAAGAVNVAKTEDNPLFSQFLQECEFSQTGSILLCELEEAVDWPDFYHGEQVTRFISPAEVKDRGYRQYERGQGSDWRGAGRLTVASKIIAQSIPSILMTHHVADAHVFFTNDNLLGEMEVEIFPNSMRPLIPGENVRGFKTALEKLILLQVANPISHNGQISVTASIDCSVVTDIKVTISLDGEPEELFAVPMYCDGLISPQKTDDLDLASKISNDLKSTITEISDEHFRTGGAVDELSNFSWN